MKYICVYCGSSDNAPESHKLAAKTLGKAIVAAGYGLVYGGAKVGLMGCLANSVLEAGGEVQGVVTQDIQKLGVVHDGIKLTVAANYERRKQIMRDLSDGFIALPGGLGTLDELLNTAINNQFASFSEDTSNPVKPIGVLNVDGFFDYQLRQLDVSVNCNYMKQSHRDMVFAAENATSLVEHLQSFKRPEVDADRWWEKKESTLKPKAEKPTASETTELSSEGGMPEGSLKNRWLKQWDQKKEFKPQQTIQAQQSSTTQVNKTDRKLTNG